MEKKRRYSSWKCKITWKWSIHSAFHNIFIPLSFPCLTERPVFKPKVEDKQWTKFLLSSQNHFDVNWKLKLAYPTFSCAFGPFLLACYSCLESYTLWQSTWWESLTGPIVQPKGTAYVRLLGRWIQETSPQHVRDFAARNAITRTTPHPEIRSAYSKRWLCRLLRLEILYQKRERESKEWYDKKRVDHYQKPTEFIGKS